MEIREAAPEDYDAIVRLAPSREELFVFYPKGRHPFTMDQLRALADTRHGLTVVVRDRQVVGFADLYDLRPDRWAFIGNVIIGRAHRREGIGGRLVRYMVEAAFEKYLVREARISVFNENTPALLLYSGLGFEPYSMEERRDPRGRRIALIHMKLSR